MVHKVDADGATVDNEFTDGDEMTPATQLVAKFFNMIQRELVAVVEAAGIALDDEDDAQLLAGIRQLGVPTGVILPFTGTTAPAGFLFAGQTVLRADYPRLWAFAQASGNLAADNTEYLAQKGMYGPGNGATTFDLPIVEDFIKGLAAGNTIGHYQADQMQAISGTVGMVTPDSYGGTWSADGAFSTMGSSVDTHMGNDTGGLLVKKVVFDSANSPGARTGAYTRPRSVVYPYIIKT